MVGVDILEPAAITDGNALPADPLDFFYNSGYNIARMRCEIVFSPQAIKDLRALKTHWRAVVLDAIETHLRYTPARTSKSRIKRLRGFSRPQFRLRVDEIRIFYDVTEEAVEILAVIPKSAAATRLAQAGEQE